MLANARKDHSSPLIVVVNIIIQYIYLLSFLSPFSFLLLLFCVVLVLFYFILFFLWGGGGSRLNFRRLPGPVFDPPRRETAGRVTR